MEEMFTLVHYCKRVFDIVVTFQMRLAGVYRPYSRGCRGKVVCLKRR